MWFTLSGAGEPYKNLDVALDATQALGYTTMRICAALLLLFGGLGPDDLAPSVPIEGLGQTITALARLPDTSTLRIGGAESGTTPPSGVGNIM